MIVACAKQASAENIGSCFGVCVSVCCFESASLVSVQFADDVELAAEGFMGHHMHSLLAPWPLVALTAHAGYRLGCAVAVHTCDLTARQ